MNKFQKVFLGVVILLLVLVTLGLFNINRNGSLGQGLVQNLPVDFTQGLRVNGTSIISSSGGVSATTGAFSGAVTALRSVVAPAGDATLTAAQSGSIVKMNTAGQDVTLPTATAGLHYRFVVTAAVATTNMTIVAAPADTIEGTLIVAGAVVDCDAADIITFVIDGENIGDFVDLYSDGTSWLIGESGTLTASKMTCSG